MRRAVSSVGAAHHGPGCASDWGRACVTCVGWWPSGVSPSSRSVASSASMRMRSSTGSTTTGSPSSSPRDALRASRLGRTENVVVPGSGRFIEGGVAVPSTRPFGSVRQRGRLYEASYWHNGRRHVAPMSFTTKGDARAFLSAVETDIRRGVWIDPWAGPPPGVRTGRGVDRLQPDQAGVHHGPGGADPPSPRAADHRLAPHRAGRATGTSSGSSTCGVPSTPLGRSSATTRWCEPCSATPCATTGSPGIRAATSTCPRSMALVAST